MKILSIFLLFYSFIFAYTLKNSYEYDDPTIYSSHLFPDISKNFILLTVPSHLQHFQLSQKRIFKLFNRKHISLEGKAHGVVKFFRANDINNTSLKKRLSQYYLEHLPFLNIKSIDIKPSRYIKSLPANYKIHFRKQLFKRNKGTFKITTDKIRIFFNFTINATYSQFQTKTTMAKGTLLTFKNTKIVIVPFKQMYTSLIGYDNLFKVETKRYLRASKPITLKDITAITLVKKGANVNVKLIEGNILIGFTAKALGSGKMGEDIFIKKDDGNKLKAKIIGKNRVRIK